MILFTVVITLKQTIKGTVSKQLQQYFSYINTEIGTPPNLQIAQKFSHLLNVKIIITGKNLHWSSIGKLPPNNEPEPSLKYNNRKTLSVHISHPPFNTTFIIQRKIPPIKTLLFNALFGVLLVLACLYLLLRHILSPLKTIQKGIQRIASGDLDHRISIKQQDDFGLLSADINVMADDIQHMLEAKRQLLLAISHELRSPLTRAKVALSLMETSALKTGLEQDINEMQGLIDELLEAEQLNHRHQVLNLSQVNVNNLIQQVIKKHYSEQPIDQNLDQRVSYQSLDKSRWVFVVKNLLSNALKHRKHANDKIIITTKYFEHNWSLIVTDQGYGIPAQHISSLTKPFFRLDSSRQRETGGYGLGLYLVKLIIEAHCGKLLIESEEKVGTCVTITKNSL
ncbi:MAG: HAMP domain-containing protein [Methylococcales bacterium]|nr:HAMP domain-containing protein [Methylococcales bacterium]